MYKQLEQQLQLIQQNNLATYLCHSKTGLEKESLRVTTAGSLSQRNHPEVLGSALTHPSITTDYAESLLELITPPQNRAQSALDYLLNIETFVYQHLDNELLWTTSMPCLIAGEDDIRIAEYGHSNAGRMKHIYRHGLAWRYGKIMQVIAGIHFNFSVDEAFWPAWHAMHPHQQTERHFRDAQYMGMVRNIQRYGWLIIYLFGASPAICQTFLNGKASRNPFSIYNDSTLYEPNGTSLRMGNIGYTNTKESDRGMRICYNSVESYVTSLRQAIAQPCEAYAQIGVKVNGEYRQLNSNVLQIENEYYSTVRPKQLLEGMEKPVDALHNRGIRYIELRSLDINPFDPAGLSATQLHFVEVFMHFCLLQESPLISETEQAMLERNQMAVAHRGRAKDLLIQKPHHKNTTLKTCATELIHAMQGVAELLDEAHHEKTYTTALQKHQEMIQYPDLTPSARVLADMQENYNSFFDFAYDKAAKHRAFFLQRILSNELNQHFTDLANQSLQAQHEMEKKNDVDFDDFLAHYFKNTAI